MNQSTDRKREWLLYAGTLAAFAVAGQIPAPYQSYIMVAAMLYVPMLDRSRALPRLKASDPVALRRWVGLSAVFLVGFVLVMLAWGLLWQQRTWQNVLPSDLLNYLLATTMAAAIPEEWYFRGYLLQSTTHNRRWWQISRANAGNALLFGLVHVLVNMNPARIIVAIPSLWYGAMREQGCGLAAGMAAHAVSNLAMYWVLSGLGYPA